MGNKTNTHKKTMNWKKKAKRKGSVRKRKTWHSRRKCKNKNKHRLKKEKKGCEWVSKCINKCEWESECVYSFLFYLFWFWSCCCCCLLLQLNWWEYKSSCSVVNYLNIKLTYINEIILHPRNLKYKENIFFTKIKT